MKELISVISGLLIIFLLPVLAYFCVKFGTVAFYKAKQFIKEEEKRKENE